MSKIVDIKAREILDSKGCPTIEVEVTTQNGNRGIYSVSSGISTGGKEAIELRDNDERYGGKGVLKAVNNINTIIKDSLVGIEVSHQMEIDKKLIELDGSSDKSKLGANSMIGVSIACLKASALEKGRPMYDYLTNREKRIPKSMFTVINGGKHSNNNLDIQEFMIVPKMDSFKESLRCASEVFHSLKKILEDESLTTSLGETGGFAPNLENNKSAINYIIKAIETSGYIPGKNVFLALDVSATSLYNEQVDKYKIDDKLLTREELLDYYIDLCSSYPIISIEDPFSENDVDGFKIITEKLGKGLNIVGDDLFATNKKELNKGIENHIANSILISPNKIGTFYEMLETIVLSHKNKYTTIMSIRSGETNDTFIVDAAVALNIPFIKAGSVSKGECVCKYNRLLKIEEELNN